MTDEDRAYCRRLIKVAALIVTVSVAAAAVIVLVRG
jgi:hypothetical protein